MPDVFFDVIDEGTTVDVIIENPVIDVGVDEQIVSIVTVEGPAGPQGLPGDGVPKIGETPSGAMNGSNTVFTTAATFRAGTTAVYLNGLREFEYTETGANQITLEDPPLSGDSLRIDYVI